MQHYHVLKKLNFALLAHPQGRGGGGGFRKKYLVPLCCIRDSLQFDMQHDHVLKKLNFDLLTIHRVRVGGGGGPRGGTLIFSHKRRLGPFFGVQNSEFQYFLGFQKMNIFLGGMKILWIFFGVITKLGLFEGHFYAI